MDGAGDPRLLLEVFPMVSRDGQKAILRQALEITPGSKLLYSSDGH